MIHPTVRRDHPSTAIVTLAIGKGYVQSWKRLCERSWRAYGQKHGYDVFCVDRPLDTSGRARRRSPAWQKCLVLSQDFSGRYERIVWVDADVLINAASAPDILEGIPIEKVGAVAAYSTPTRELFVQAFDRTRDYWASCGVEMPRERTPQEYYRRYGPPLTEHDEVVQSGVLVLSPAHHRDLLEKTYYNYEPRRGDAWDGTDAWGEMRPLSHELLQDGCVQWLDHRFNQGWIPYKLLHYPFLAALEKDRRPTTRLRAKLAAAFGMYSLASLKRACVTGAFLNSYFLHFAGDKADMSFVDTRVRSWHDCWL